MVVFATSKGNVRKNSLEDFININNSGKIAMKLDQDDKIIGVKYVRMIKIFYLVLSLENA